MVFGCVWIWDILWGCDLQYWHMNRDMYNYIYIIICTMGCIKITYDIWELGRYGYIFKSVRAVMYTYKYGYGSIPINTIFRGMNIHLPAILMFTRGARFWPISICSYVPQFNAQIHRQLYWYVWKNNETGNPEEKNVIENEEDDLRYETSMVVFRVG